MKRTNSRFFVVLYALLLLPCSHALASDEVKDLAPGIRYVHRVTADPLNAFFLTIDLKQPGVRLQPVLSKDMYNDYRTREVVSSVVKRYHALAGINGDYFGYDHGPEGLNFVLGAPAYTGWNRSAFNLSATGEPTIDLANTLYEKWQNGQIDLFNCLGGGPIFMRNDLVLWNYDSLTINGESFPGTGEPWTSRQPWTAVGISADKTKVVLGVVDGRQSTLSRGVTPQEMGALLVEFGASDAIKMDGGGSSEMVVNNVIVNSPSDGNERQVANFLLVFYEPPQ